ncbi:MAG: PEGA domain-containing protein, partial [Kiritimatiellaeota bacterium]|nr:PEGA domain-containing protein [Kiritimatiellota bacterium]
MKRTALLLLLPALAALAQKKADEPAATVTIQSDPAGATLLIDREPVGVTPATVETTPGPHLLTLQKPGHSDTFDTIRPIAGAQNILNYRLEPLVTWVLLHSDPMGAEVSSENISLGVTPTLVKVVAPSVRTLQFSLAGFQSKTIQLEVANQTPVMKTVSLLSDTGTLELTTTPPGARILVDGVDRGATPKTLTRLDSEVTLEVLLDGYLPVTHKIRINAGDTQALDLPLQPEPATLSVASIPNAARVYLNDAFQGEAPIDIKNLPPGQYRVRAEREGCDPDARTVELGNGQKRSIEFRLASNRGRLEITTQPAGVDIFIDGQKMGRTLVDSAKSDAVSLPTPVEDVPTGAR